MIKTENLTKKFEDYKALDTINCTIPEGCIYGMVGSNGAGKSTFLRLISGIYKADEGNVLIDEEEVYENPRIKSQIAFVPDELFFLNGANMDRMAQFYRACYPSFDEQIFIRHIPVKYEKSADHIFKGDEETGGDNSCYFLQTEISVF